MKWIFENDGRPETIERERWAWEALYADGSRLQQFDETGKFHQFREIGQGVAVFSLYKPDDKDKRIDIALPGGAEPIHLYRNFVFNSSTPDEFKARVYVFGYKHNGHTHYNFILPDDRVVQATTDQILLADMIASI